LPYEISINHSPLPLEPLDLGFDVGGEIPARRP
jgi:hypothetical protein